jgi:hypothetical protein
MKENLAIVREADESVALANEQLRDAAVRLRDFNGCSQVHERKPA